jgi:hypothetical protein
LFSYIEDFTHIELQNIYKLSDSFLRVIASKNHPTLVQLTLDSFNAIWTGCVINDILSLCNRLIYLRLLDCTHLAEVDFNDLCLYDNILTKLTIKHADALTTQSLLLLVERSKCLLKLHVEHCVGVSRSVVEDFVDDNRPELLFW